MHKLIVPILVFFITCCGFAQNTDLARIEYTYFPQKNSDNSFRRFRSSVAFPIRVGNEGTYLVPGLEYRNVHFVYDDPEDFNTDLLDRFQSFTATLGYTFKIDEDWRFGAQGGLKIASNFSRNEILNDDLIYTGSLFFVKIREDENYEDNWRLILGLHYSTTTGFPFPLPILNYHKRWDENWSYMVGTPKSNIKYYFNDKHSLEAFATLDGFFANIQKNFDATPSGSVADELAESISMTVLLSGLEYQYKITEHLRFYVYAGHTILNDIRLRDADKNDVYTINEINTFYARSGLKFSIF
ncbi:hypothetical protein EZJ28_13940 [Gramella sp. KN1008]|nr:DUF6268 family outer membrane beta-barrel protein [Gramella sp. KN1008]TBW26568.1 hypothetical protein EZJ28_13940 [Gramella sp. KN1008]